MVVTWWRRSGERRSRSNECSRRALALKGGRRASLALEVLEARNLLSFLPPVTYGVGNYVVAVAVGDFDGDGTPDIATTNDDSQTVSVLLGNGDGTFQPAVNYYAGPDPFGLATGHFHDPNILDLAVANVSTHAVSVLLGNGNGTFQPPVAYGFGPSTVPASVAVGDLTGTGTVDIVTANRTGNNQGSVSVMRGNGDGTFQAPVTYPLPTTGWAQGIAIGDFNGDGVPDLAATSLGASSPHGVSILLGNGDGTFQPAQFVGSGVWSSVVAADLRQAGADDLVVGGNGLHVLLNNGDGTFQAPVPYLSSGVSDVAVADFNRDGALDIVASHFPKAVALLLGNGDGTFQPPVDYDPGPDKGALAVGDFNGDQFPDLAVANQETASVSVLINAADWSSPGGRGAPRPAFQPAGRDLGGAAVVAAVGPLQLAMPDRSTTPAAEAESAASQAVRLIPDPVALDHFSRPWAFAEEGRALSGLLHILRRAFPDGWDGLRETEGVVLDQKLTAPVGEVA